MMGIILRLLRNCRKHVLWCNQVQYLSQNIQHKSDINKIRNIGIIAHIDAGKTTTTERFLYYSGFTHFMGEVHHGDTVMDYMVQERERGITIVSAAITFNWRGHKINLIDTPGHVDFTMEVTRALKVLDGAIVILDASAGVEAQTLKVWSQADKYMVPRIIYLNKMDKQRANCDACINDIEDKLKSKSLLLHLPLGEGKEFKGVIDLITMEKVEWKLNEKKDGQLFVRTSLKSNIDEDLWELSNKKREDLIDQIADLDDIIAEKILNDETIRNITSDDLNEALHRITHLQKAVPVMCGSSYRNIGVQLLMDNIIKYLPNPLENEHEFVRYYGSNLCALAFKVQYNKQFGQLTFLRIYSGILEEGKKIYNATQDNSEKVEKVMIALADELKEVKIAHKGNIVVVTGLKNIITGDTITSSHSAANNARKEYAKCKDLDIEDVPDVLGGIEVPDPVFFCSIEPPSLSYQNKLDHALKCLQIEDPSFKVYEEEESGQTIISGMGELHIDVMKKRILHEYKVDAFLGQLRIAYKETILNICDDTIILDKFLGNTKHFVKIKLLIKSSPSSGKVKHIKVIVDKENELGKIRLDYLKAVENGVVSALNHGPVLGFPVFDVKVELHWLEVGRGTSLPMISAAASQCVVSALKKGDAQLLEPIMKMEINTDESYLGKILADLSNRRSQILNIQAKQDARIVNALTPLSELITYTTDMRILTSGRASVNMEFECHKLMTSEELRKVKEQVTGFMFR
ncbi:ribosome-releasing factor 2, mitochondrial [Centruroides vittatus]|uniref:ribosome-releasing factor 2, mitochondrial n=1 Tax=Centruroides vittatus TaxID=120091 RepID=UPI003510A257